MIPILEAISNSIYAPLAVALAGQPVSVQRGPGGFSSALAAARGFSAATAQPPAGEVESADASVRENAGAVTNLNTRMMALGNPQLKKFLNGSSVPGSAVNATVNIVASGFISTPASQIPSHPPQSSLLQPSLPPTPTATAPGQVPDVASGTVQTALQTTAYDAAVQSAPFGHSAPSQTAGIFGSLTSPRETAGNANDPSMASGLILSASGQTDGPETATANGAQSSALSTAARASGVVLPTLPSIVSPNLAAGSPQNGSKDGLGSAEPRPLAESAPPSALAIATGWNQSDAVLPSVVLPSVVSPNPAAGGQWNSSKGGLVSTEPAQLAENTPPPALSITTGQPTLGTVSLNVAQDNPGSPSVTNGPGLGSAESTWQADQSIQPIASAPILVASVTSRAGLEAGAVFWSAMSLQIDQSNSGNAIAPDTAASSGLYAEPGTGTPVSGIIDGQISALSIPNPAAQLVPEMAALRFAAAKVTAAVTSPSVRGTGQGTGARPSILSSMTSTLSTGSDAGDGSPMANQTPFAVFFSGPGPGTESAASALPKMILPVAGPAMRADHATCAAPSASAQTSGLQAGTSQGSASQSSTSQNAAPPTTKASLSGPESGSLQAGQPSHRDADLSAAGAQVASSQNAAAPPTAPPASTAAIQPVSVPATPTTESLPKPDTLSGGSSGSPASAVPMPPQIPAAAVPGPVQMAQLVNRIGQSEMRIGMNTSAFGSVEVRTVIHANDVGLVIGSEKGDLHTLLANELPAISSALQQQSLRLNSVNFMQGFAFSNNASGGGDSQQRSFVPMRASAGSVLSEIAVDDAVEVLPPAGWYGSGGSLSILA